VHALMASPTGAIVRGLHAWGADALIILVALHLLRVFYIGAYKPPRELTWVTGALLLAVTIGFAFTGYLLPWDQQAYWATVVGTAMAAYAPVVGQGILQFLRGGTNITGATLTRFYALHVLVLPALLLLIVGSHFALVLAHGVTDVEARLPRGYRAAHRKGDTRDFPRGDYLPFWPYTPAQMTVGIAAVAAILLILALAVRVPLLAAADPLNRANYKPVPAWYFYGIYQFLKFLPGRLDALGMVGLPLVAAVVLIGLPFFDKNPARLARRRPYAMAAASVVVAAALALTYLGWRTSKGTPVNAAVVSAPTYAANIQPIFAASCTGCHGAAAPSGGLDLTSYAGLMKGGRSGAVIKPGNPQGSLLIEVLEGRAPGGIPAMPLGQQPLPATQIQTIKNWIASGAKGP
jgi:ubiquinol-cytochrome c reductase cytochrome b subunit